MVPRGSGGGMRKKKGPARTGPNITQQGVEEAKLFQNSWGMAFTWAAVKTGPSLQT